MKNQESFIVELENPVINLGALKNILRQMKKRSNRRYLRIKASQALKELSKSKDTERIL